MSEIPANENGGEVILGLLERIKDGDNAAYAEFWSKFASYAEGRAQRSLGRQHRRLRDPQDIVCSTMRSIYLAIRDGRLSTSSSDENVRMYLTKVIANKVRKHIERETTLKRGAGRVRGESAFRRSSDQASSDRPHSGIDAIPNSDGDFESGLLFYSEFRDSLDLELTEIFDLKLEGYEQKQIASRLGISESTVSRRSEILKRKLSRAMTED